MRSKCFCVSVWSLLLLTFCIKSPIVLTLCLSLKHLLVGVLFSLLENWWLIPIWYQAGSFFFRESDNFSDVKLRLKSLPTLSIVLIFLGRVEPGWIPGRHVWSYTFICARLETAPEPLVILSPMSTSAMYAQVGRL